ncbi:hypothetical protein EYV94_06140 [Puteibacter caeruleilacunae]|nr:hypothetical protein EYV94_06140 [Puteibacter caeruleilacunae]
MKRTLFLPIGLLSLGLYFILNRYSAAPDFILGLLVGLSIPLNLAGIFASSKWLKKQSGKS